MRDNNPLGAAPRPPSARNTLIQLPSRLLMNSMHNAAGATADLLDKTRFNGSRIDAETRHKALLVLFPLLEWGTTGPQEMFDKADPRYGVLEHNRRLLIKQPYREVFVQHFGAKAKQLSQILTVRSRIVCEGDEVQANRILQISLMLSVLLAMPTDITVIMRRKELKEGLPDPLAEDCQFLRGPEFWFYLAASA